ncbi:MAG: carboxypeptidase-like regulatory domain-containing protein [Terracidiphilus sp.]
MSLGRVKVLAGVAFAFLAAGAVPSEMVGGLLSPPPARAQNIGQRVVNGTVFDASSNTVSGATVFLKDLKTKTIRSFSSDPKGKFRFTQVDMAEDHELWAEKDGHKSAVKTVSEWDARKDFETELKLK